MRRKSGVVAANAVFVLGSAGGLSGGDVHALRLVEAWNESAPGDVSLLGPEFLRPFVAPAVPLVAIEAPFAEAMRTRASALIAGLAWRGARAAWRARRCERVVASSHLVFDVAPAAAVHLVSGAHVAAFVYHLIADSDRPPGLRNRSALLLEACSLWMLRAIAATILVDNHETRVALIARGFSSSRLFPTTNAYDPIVDIPAKQVASPPRLVFIGRLVAQKGIDEVVALARSLRDAGVDAEIDVIGDGPESTFLAAIVRDENLNNVSLHGFVDETTKWTLLSRAALLIAPSREEGWGIAVGEALLSGTPVVAYDLPAYSNLGDAVQRVPTARSDEFVAAVRSLLDDHGALEQLTARAFDARAMLPRWAEIVALDLETIVAEPVRT